MSKLTLCIFIFYFSWVSASAQEDSISKVQVLDDITVTSQRKPQRDLNVPSSTVSLSRSFMDNYQPRTTPEALMGANGVFIQRTNQGGGSPFVRGLTGNQTLILVDGIRLNNSTFRYGPNQYLNTIDAYTVSKIEVAKGTGSVQYGSDAIGGVIQIFTKDPSLSASNGNSWAGKASGKYMSGDMEKTIRGEATYSSRKSALIVGATYRNFGDVIGGDTTGKQSPSGYREFAFDVKSKFALHRNAELTLAHQFLQQKDVPVYHRIILENFGVNEFDPQQRMLNYAKLKIKNTTRWMEDIEITGSWQRSIEGRNSRKNGSNILRKERDEINTIGFTTDISSRFSGAWSANSGVELYVDKVNSSRKEINSLTAGEASLRGLYPDRSGYVNSSLYSLHHFSFRKWAIESGVRYNLFAINLTDTTLGKIRITPSSFVYNASLLYKPADRQSIYISFNTGYRAPNIDDMGTLGIVDFRYEVPAPGLAPERSRNIELGYKIQTGRWKAGISGYYMHLDNLITRVKEEGRVINGYPVYRKENTEEAYIKGLETEVDFQPGTGWHISGNIAYTYGQSLSRNEPLRRIPPFNGRIMSSYHLKGWFGSAALLFASKQDRLAQGDKDDNRIPAGGTPGWKTLDVFAGREFKNVRLNVALQNIFNEDYRTHGSGINGVGRSGWLAVSVTF